MRIKYCSLLFLISNLIVGSNGWIILDAIKSVKDSFGDPGEKTKVLYFSDLYQEDTYELRNMADILYNPRFNKDRQSVIYIHGYIEDGEDGSATALKEAYLSRNDHNFIAIDWSAFSRLIVGVPYFSNIPKLKKVCQGIAEQLEKIRKKGYRDFYLVGYSLGGQCAGLIGRTLKEISYNQYIIPRIYALDPVGPDFETFASFYGWSLILHFDSISKDDAAYVQVIHTNGNRYGLKKSAGHSDFYPNGGMSQPGCGISGVCSYLLSWRYFAESVRNEGVFVARRCISMSAMQKGLCESGEISYMGYSSNGTRPIGNFVLMTWSSEHIAGMGPSGIKI